MARRAALAVTRLGVFGGTFDPPHLGHLIIAEWARDRLRLDRVLFVPSGAPPHKRTLRLTSPAQRVAMTQLAVRGHRDFDVSDVEAKRRGPSFTVDTLEGLRNRHPRARLFFIMGRDSLDEFHTWHAPERIAALATLVVAGRPGAGRRRALTRRVTWLENPLVDIASSALRRRVRAGRSIRYLVPDAVETFIRRHRLYARAR